LNRGNGQPFGQGYQAQVSGGLKLFFTPTLIHLATVANQSARQKHFTFYITALDRNCPIEGESRRVVQLTVKPFPAYRAPRLDSLVSTAGQVRLHFWSGFDTLSIDSADIVNFAGALSPANQQMLLQKSIDRRIRAFDGLRIYKAVQRNGPYQLLATITDPRTRSWLDNSSVPGNFYYIEHLSGRPQLALRSQDTLSTCNIGQLDVVSPQGNWLCGASSLALNASLQGAGRSYTWYRNQQLLSGQSGPGIVVSDSGAYVVVVYDSVIGCSSTSNPFRVRRGGPFLQEQLCAVTVDTLTGRNLILWQKTPDQGTRSYWVLRERTPGVYDTLANIPWALAGAFLDTGATTTLTSWKYTLLLEDSCGQLSGLSAVHRSMHLTAQTNANNEVILTWNGYEGRPIGFQRIMYAHNGTTFTAIGTVAPTERVFTHSQAPAGPKAYFVAFGSPADCQVGPGFSYPAGVASNMVDVGSGVGLPWLDTHRAVVYPNPGTGLFRASWGVPAVEQQELQLYNSYGQKVRSFRLPAGESALELDLQGEAPGVYMLRSPGSAWIERIVLLR